MCCQDSIRHHKNLRQILYRHKLGARASFSPIYQSNVPAVSFLRQYQSAAWRLVHVALRHRRICLRSNIGGTIKILPIEKYLTPYTFQVVSIPNDLHYNARKLHQRCRTNLLEFYLLFQQMSWRSFGWKCSNPVFVCFLVHGRFHSHHSFWLRRVLF